MVFSTLTLVLVGAGCIVAAAVVWMGYKSYAYSERKQLCEALAGQGWELYALSGCVHCVHQIDLIATPSSWLKFFSPDSTGALKVTYCDKGTPDNTCKFFAATKQGFPVFVHRKPGSEATDGIKRVFEDIDMVHGPCSSLEQLRGLLRFSAHVRSLQQQSQQQQQQQSQQQPIAQTH